MAWFLAYHIGLDHEVDLEKKKHRIGLFHSWFREYLPQNVLGKVDSFTRWHKFLKKHRDPTAHRIPPYIMNYRQTATGEKDYTPWHVSDFEKGPMVPLHAQAIVDVRTILELTEAMLTDVSTTTAS